MEQIIKVDKAGNFKIPQEIKKSLKLKKDDNLLVFSSNDSIIIKRIKSQKLKGRVENLSDKICKKFKTDKISKADLTRAVEWARK